ncbi:MAG: dihydropteroate synthase [Candidatus Heimdallarchaeota archaeon]|nr:dihydropteroate synthase [Candidatus Heimdallarchaeota archaeon]
MTLNSEHIIQGELGGLKLGDNCDPLIIGVINLSPTSFYKGSVNETLDAIKFRVNQLIEEGVDIIDVGGVSSAPVFLYNESEVTSTETEIKRLTTFFNAIEDQKIPVPISVDTQCHKTAQFALENGATVINDISGLKTDENMANTISSNNASTIVMACRDQPGDVFRMPEIIMELGKSIELGVSAGIPQSSIIIDPGLGSWIAQRNEHDDYTIINQLGELRILNQCILVGISRKSFIGAILGVPPKDRLWGSLAATSIAIIYGAHSVRTHDVRATKDACLIAKRMKKLG